LGGGDLGGNGAGKPPAERRKQGEITATRKTGIRPAGDETVDAANANRSGQKGRKAKGTSRGHNLAGKKRAVREMWAERKYSPA